MLERLKYYQKKQLTLKQLIQSLEALLHALEDEHKHFTKLFFPHWETLEIEYASMRCGSRKELSTKQKIIVNTATDELITLISTYLDQPDQLESFEKLNATQALCAFILFLQTWNQKKHSPEAEELIKKLQFTTDAISNDLTLWNDWHKITNTLENPGDILQILDRNMAFQVTLSFIDTLKNHRVDAIAANIGSSLQTSHGQDLWKKAFDIMAQSPIGFFPEQCWLVTPK